MFSKKIFVSLLITLTLSALACSDDDAPFISSSMSSASSSISQHSDASQSTASSEFSTSAESSANAGQPVIPILQVNQRSTTSIALSWSSYEEATSYRVKRGTAPTGPWATRTTTSLTNYTDTGLNANTTYYYILYPIIDLAEGPHSETLVASTIPSAPTRPSLVEITPDTISLDWPDMAGIISYQIWRKTGTEALALIATVQGSAWVDSGLTESTTYTYALRAVSLSGESPLSDELGCTTDASVNRLFIDLPWGNNIRQLGLDDDTEVYYFIAEAGAQYNIYWDDANHDGGLYPNTLLEVIASNTSKTFRYFFNDSGAYTTPSTITTASNSGKIWLYTYSAYAGEFDIRIERVVSAPATPTGLSIVPVSPTSLRLSWTASPQATSYTIQRSANAGGPWTTIKSGLTATTYTDTPLASDSSWWYKISSSNTIGTSAYSSGVLGTTPSAEDVLYAGQSYTGRGTTLDAGSPRVSSNYPALIVSMPDVRRFNADGFFILAGSNGYLNQHKYNLVTVSHDATGKRSFYKLPGSHTRRIWLPFGKGNYTVKVYLGQTYYNNLGWTGDYIENDASGNYLPYVASANHEYEFKVNNTRDQDGQYLYPSEAVQSDEVLIANAAKDAIQGITGREAQARALHDLVVKRLYYDDASLETGKRSPQDALSSFNSKKAVCEGYASLYAALLRSQGIRAKCIFGKGGTVYHAWNAVADGSTWKLVDTTWDDPGPNDDDPTGANLRWTYFWKDSLANHQWINDRPWRAVDRTGFYTR